MANPVDTPHVQPRFSLTHASVPGGVVTNLNTVINQLIADANARRRQLDDMAIERFIDAVSNVYR
jgi:hypothetical protein